MENDAISGDKDQEMFSAALGKIKEHSVLDISSWSARPYRSWGGTIVTANRMVYGYQFCYIIPTNAKPEDFTFIKKLKQLSQEEYDKITNFIESEIIDKEFQDKMVYDCGTTLTINYNGVHKEIDNNGTIEGEPGVYDEAKQLVNEILGRVEQ